MKDYSSPSRFPFPAVAAKPVQPASLPAASPATPPSCFDSLERTSEQLRQMMADPPAPTIKVGGQVLPASYGFKPVLTFRQG